MPKNEHEGIIRFHVLANSDSAEDQALKLKVRDGVLDAINEDMIRETMKQYEDGEKDVKKVELDPEESRKYIKEELEKKKKIPKQKD